MVKYNNKEHYQLLCSWFRARKMPIPLPEFLSDCGYVVNNNCIGFLFKTNSKQCYIDNVIVDPKATTEQREESLISLFKHLQNIATEEDYLLMFAMVELPNMKRRFAELNFNMYKDYTLFYKLLQGVN